MPKQLLTLFVLLLLLPLLGYTQSSSSVSSNGAIILNGSKFFPIGCYGINWQKPFSERMEALQILSASGFNTMFAEDISTSNFGDLLDEAASKNMYIMVGSSSLPDNQYIGTTVDKYKSKPAVLGWSLYDDADDGRFTPQEIKQRSDFVKSKDPTHFTYSALTGYYTIRRTNKTEFIKASDASSLQAYTITPPIDYSFDYGGNPLLESYRVTRDYVVSAEQNGKAMIANTQTFNWGRKVGDRYPSVKELRNMFYGQIIAGVKGIISYDFSKDLYDNQKPLWNEFVALKDDILQTLKNPILDGSFTRNSTADSELFYSYWQYNNACYVAVVNTSTTSAKNVDIPIPAIYNGAAVPLFARLPNTLTYSNNKLSGSINASDVEVYKIIATTQPKKITYEADNTTIFANPERGWHVTYETCLDDNGLLNVDELRNLRVTNKVTLVRKNYLLRLYKNAPIAQSFLNSLQTDLNTCRTAGVKMVVLFRYNACEGQPAPNAPKERIFEHIDQLAPILTANKDVISHVAMGFVGAYGEWIFPDDPSLLQMPASGQILDKMLDNWPTDRMVTLRFAKIKREIFNSKDPITIADAYTGAKKARVGAENCSFGSNEIDYGTYYFGEGAGRTADAELVKSYLERDNNFLVVSGETSGLCGEEAGDFIYHQCDYALATLKRLKYSTLSHYELYDVNAPCNTIPIWEAGGCEPEMKRKLGYRFRLIEATVPQTAMAGTTINFTLKMANDGWARPYNPRKMELVLRKVSDNSIVRIVITPSQDARLLLPGPDETKDISLTAVLPVDVTAGDYELLFNLADPETRLTTRPEYAMRLANNNTWEETTGFNKLLHTVNIVAAAALPVSLLEFNAKKKEQNILLEWAVQNPVDFSGFEVQHSTDGVQFSKNDFVKAAGTNKYEFLHQTATRGYNYYRLKMIDNNGKYQYSPTRLLNIGEGENLVQVYPNPTTNNAVTLSFNANEISNIELRISDLGSGKIIQMQKFTAQRGNNSKIIDISELKSGIYSLSMKIGTKTTTKKLIVSR